MAYSVADDIRKVLVGQRGTDEDLNPNTLDDDQIGYAISNADAQIDAALRNKYHVPILIGGVAPTTVPTLIHSLSVDIASYLSFLTYRQDREFMSTLAAPLLRYQRAMGLLTGIQTGDVELELDAWGLSSDDASTVFNPYDGPLFPSANIFNAPEGIIPPDWVYR
jgi:phage gp36-like protein